MEVYENMCFSLCKLILKLLQYNVWVLRAGESPSVTELCSPICASPGCSSLPFVIIKFSESRFCLSDTLRGSCEKTISPREDVWGGKAAETNVFHQGKDSLDRLFKTITFARVFHYHIWDGGHRGGEGRSQNKSLQKRKCLISYNLLILISIYILNFLLLYSILVLYFSFQIVHCIYFHSQEVNSV